MSKETIFVINKRTVSAQNQERVQQIARTIPGAQVHNLTEGFRIPEQADIVVACGGDGTILTLSDQIHPEQNFLVLPLGSHNGFGKGLERSGAIVTVDELRNRKEKDLPVFSPGYINNVKFLHGAAWDKIGVGQGIATEKLRWILPETLRRRPIFKHFRAYVGALYSALKYNQAFSDEHVISMALLGPNMGSITVDPTQELLSDSVLLARIPGGSNAVQRLWKVFYTSLLHKPLPTDVVELERNTSFDIDAKKVVSMVIVDGEVVNLQKNVQTIHIERRREQGFRTGVLLERKKSR